MKTETLSALIVANRAACRETRGLITGFDALVASSNQTEQMKTWCANQVEESKQVLAELDNHLNLLIKSYWEGLKDKDT